MSGGSSVFSPASLAEAVTLLAEHPDLLLVAGCTDLMVCEPEDRAGMQSVMNLLNIPEIRGIEATDQGLRIGAATTFTEIGSSSLVTERYPALAEAAQVVGGWQIQNRATVGGNIVNASPAGDSLPALLALGAEMVGVSASGERRVPYAEFHVDYRKTALREGELLGWIHLPPPASFQRFRKVGTREAQAISKVVVAMSAAISSGKLSEVRIGAGSVAAVPVRLTAVETVCEGMVPDEALAEKAAAAAMASVKPIDDVRSDADYRKRVLGRVVRRMVLQAGGTRTIA